MYFKASQSCNNKVVSDFRLEAQESFNLPSKIETLFNYANLSTFDGTQFSMKYSEKICNRSLGAHLLELGGLQAGGCL